MFEKNLAKAKIKISYKDILEPKGNSIYKILSNYDLMVFLTYCQGEKFPGAILDSYISGVPVIASDWKYNNELLENKMKKYKFALIGCGRISYKHINTINVIENAKLATICDIKKERAKTKGEENNIPWYTDYYKMLGNEDIDIVNILVESGKHTEVFKDIAKYKKHIIVENQWL